MYPSGALIAVRVSLRVMVTVSTLGSAPGTTLAQEQWSRGRHCPVVKSQKDSLGITAEGLFLSTILSRLPISLQGGRTIPGNDTQDKNV
jgi:hypothetical protein